MISAIGTNLINLRIISPYIRSTQSASAVSFRGDSTNLIQQYLDFQVALNAHIIIQFAQEQLFVIV